MKSAGIALKRCDKVISSLTSETKNKVVHSKYDTFIKSPIATIENIYKQLGYEFTEEYRGILEDYVEKDKIARQEFKKKGIYNKENKKHNKPTLETYGLTEEMINERFSWYYEKYLNQDDA